MEVISAKLPTPEFTEFTKAAEASKLAKTRFVGKALNEQEAFLRAVPTGAVDEATTIKHWGFGGKNKADIQEVFEAFGVKGYMRERSPRAFQLIDTLKEAIWKPEAMKPKGINDLDLLLLGDNSEFLKLVGKEPDKMPIGLDGITAIFMPDDDKAIRRRLKLRGESEEVIKAAQARAQLRREEFEEYVPEFELWKLPIGEGGGIPVGKNYLDNGVPNPPGQDRVKRKFAFQRIAREGQPTIYVPQMAIEDGLLRYISGDIDWVHFSFLNGAPLDAGTAYRLYESLSRCCGLQHPETISWIKKGQTVFKGKISQLRDYLTGDGQKALLEVSGKDTRAVKMSENFTRFSKDGRNHRIYFDGGLKSRAQATLADIESAFAKFQKKYPDRRLLTPFLWITRPGQEDSGTMIDGKDWSITTIAKNAVLARLGLDGSIERFEASGDWVTWDLAAETEKLALTPATKITSDMSAGATVLPILDLPELWGERIAPHIDGWFEEGQTIIVAPGEVAQEIHQVKALGSLILEKPLKYDHPERTLVAVLPPSLEDLKLGEVDSDGDGDSDSLEALLGTDPQDPASFFRIASFTTTPNRAVVTITWPTIAGGTYTLETSTDLTDGSWSTVTTMVGEEGATETSAIAFPPEDSETRYYRVRFGN